eukprot:1013375-Rhodomonas_salina.1
MPCVIPVSQLERAYAQPHTSHVPALTRGVSLFLRLRNRPGLTVCMASLGQCVLGKDGNSHASVDLRVLRCQVSVVLWNDDFDRPLAVLFEALPPGAPQHHQTSAYAACVRVCLCRMCVSIPHVCVCLSTPHVRDEHACAYPTEEGAHTSETLAHTRGGCVDRAHASG